jgi:hypothetical protein
MGRRGGCAAYHGDLSCCESVSVEGVVVRLMASFLIS